MIMTMAIMTITMTTMMTMTMTTIMTITVGGNGGFQPSPKIR